MSHKLSEYENLLEEIRAKITDIQNKLIVTAREYIPKMYQAIINENSKISPVEARARIEKDCINLWKKRTIIDALPDYAKNLEKQKAGRQRYKNKISNSAAMIAAPKLDEQIIIDNIGRTVSDNESLHVKSSNNFKSANSKIKEDLDENYDNSLNERVLDFEFCLKFKDIQQYMAPLFNKIGDNGNVWFHGKINTKSSRVIEANFGRIREIE